MSEEIKLPKSRNIAELSGISFADFLGALAHKIRNPLTGISANVQYLQMTSSETAQQVEVYTDILQAVSRLDLTLDQAVEFLSPLEPQVYPADLNELLRSIISARKKIMVKRKRIKVETSFDASIPQAGVDAVLFGNAMNNLFDHCLNQVKTGGQVRCRTQGYSNSIDIVFSHDGRAPDVKEIFSLLHALKGPDLGLGLAYVKRIIDEHGFAISADGESGKEVRFAISVPLESKNR